MKDLLRRLASPPFGDRVSESTTSSSAELSANRTLPTPCQPVRQLPHRKCSARQPLIKISARVIRLLIQRMDGLFEAYSITRQEFFGHDCCCNTASREPGEAKLLPQGKELNTCSSVAGAVCGVRRLIH